MNKTQARNSFLLFLAAAIWGMAFVSQSKGMDYMGAFTFNGVRSLIGTAALGIYLLISHKVAGPKNREPINWKKAIIGGICCGLALTTASTLQQFGIVYTTVGKAGFITTLYIIFVPILGIFLRRRVNFAVWIAVVLAAAGMYLLCMTESFSLGLGDTLVFLCAVVYAVHILVVDKFAPMMEGALLSFIQFFFCGIVCTTCAIIWEHPTFAQLIQGIIPLLYAGVMSCGVAYTLQIVGQKGVNPTIAALLMSLESVVATISGYAAYKLGLLGTDQTMTGRQILGCVIVFAAIILVQLPEEWFTRKKGSR